MKRIVFSLVILSLLITLAFAATPSVYVTAPSHNLNQSPYNISATYFIGNGSFLTDVCLQSGANCPAGFVDTQKDTNGFYLYNDSSTIYFNETQLNITIDARFGAGANASWNQSLADTLYVTYTGAVSNVDLNSRELTSVGKLVMGGLINSQNITPITDNLYSLGNSTNWFKELWVKNIYSENINTTNLTAGDINSNTIDSVKTNTTNLTVGGYEVYKDGGGDLNINLD